MNEDNELFSYDNSGTGYESDENNEFDLNEFSSRTVKQTGDSGRGKRKRKKGKQRVLKSILTIFLIGVITFSIVCSVFLVYVFTMVDGKMDENLDDLVLNFTTTIYVDKGDGNYSEYQRLHGTFNRIWVSYDREKAGTEGYEGIPQNLIDAVVAIEDKRFYSHKGVDWKRTVSAFANLFLHFYSSNQGGSTITQQLVKNLTGDTSRKPSRKIREIMRARYFESHYAKDTIIECYLNTIAMGHGIYGVEVASNYYFGKSAKDLTLNECACLASIVQRPTYLAPDDYPDANGERRAVVLSEMLSQGYITQEEYDEAKASELNIVATKEVLNETQTNSYFVDALIDQVISDIADKYGYDETHASTNFYTGGYKVYATLDPNIQSALESVFTNTAYALAGMDGQKLQGSMTVLDYSGHVKGLVGGIGEKPGDRCFNRATSALRQPGSTMKPIAAYAPAIESDLISYSSIVNDNAVNYGGWTPVNWYLHYKGNVTVQFALEYSINAVPVHIVNKLTPQVSFDFLTKKLGITTLTNEDINLAPLGMGGTNGGLTTLESAAAFQVFGNGGLYYKPFLYTQITNQRGEEILSQTSTPVMAISEDTATVMNHLLQNVVYGAQGTGGGAGKYVPNMKIYAKTGTSNDSNDLWFVGGTPYYIGSCWCGYDTQQPISQANIALRMWGDVMSKVHTGLEAKKFTDSPYAVTKYYCTQSGMLATSSCPSKKQGWYRKSNIPGVCTAHGGTALGDPAAIQKAEADAAAAASSQAAAAENASSGENTSSQTE